MHIPSPAVALAAVLSLLLLGGCADSAAFRGSGPDYNEADPLASGDDDDDSTASGDDDDVSGDDDDGGPEILNLEPGAGSSEHHYRRPLLVVFSQDATGAEVTLSASSGALVPTTLQWNEQRTRLWVHPIAYLEPDTDYSVSIALGTQYQSYGFRTSRVGLLDVTPDSLVGRAYALGTAELAVEAPANLGSPSGFALSGAALLEVDAAGDLVSFSLGLDDGSGAQDLCSSAGPLDLDLARSQALVTGAFDLLSLPAGHTTLSIEDGWLAADFLPDGSGLAELELSGWLHAGSLGDLLDSPAPCDLVYEVSGEGCVPCPTSGGDCVYVELGGVSGVELDIDLSPVGADELAQCSEGATHWLGCSTGGGGRGSLLGLLLAGVGLSLVRRRRGQGLVSTGL